MRRPVRIASSVLILAVVLSALAALVYVVVFGAPFQSSDRCGGMPTGRQRDLCEDFASTHQSQVRPIPPDREPLPNIAAPEK
jgi:hypothetical protein